MDAQTVGDGCLLIIGGDEEEQYRHEILARFVQLSGGPERNFLLLTSASGEPDKMAAPYYAALQALGVRHCELIYTAGREEANDPARAERIRHADGILITGGDQRRLMANIGGTAVDQALHDALKRQCACLAGTSAGASAMAGHMLAAGMAEYTPTKGAAVIGAGLGFTQGVVIDQHFSQRHRINRLLSVVAQNPYLYGLGIDEDTALVIERGVGIEVIGAGAVTLVDGRRITSNIADLKEGQVPEMIGLQLHILPAGTGFVLPGQNQHATRLRHISRTVPHDLIEFIDRLTRRTAPS